MGNCCHRCFGIANERKRYPPSKYTTEQDFSIEFESLIGEELQQNETTRLLTDRERQLLRAKQFDVLVHEQGKIDAELHSKVAQQEQEIEREEEAVYEAKREAARLARLNRSKPNHSGNNNSSWINDDEWEIAEGGDDDDFEQFLADVRARVLSVNSHASGSTSGSSPSTSNTHTQGVDFAEGSHVSKEQSPRTALLLQAEVHAFIPHEDMSELSAVDNKHSNDQDWELDFVSVEDDDDKIHLLNAASPVQRATSS